LSTQYSVLGICLVVVALGLAIARLPLTVAALLVGGTAATVLVAVRPAFGLVLLAFSVPFESYAQVTLGGFSVSSTQALTALTVAVWLASCIARESWEPGPARLIVVPPLLLVTVAFLAAQLLAMTGTFDVQTSVKELLKWGSFAAIYLVAVNVVGSEERRWLVGAVLVAATLEALVGVYQFLWRVGPEGHAIGAYMRAHGDFGQPNPFAGYLLFATPLATAVAFGALRARALPLAVVAAGVAGVTALAIAMSLSRGAWLGLGLGLAAMLCLTNVRAWLVAAVASSVAVGLLLSFELLPQAIVTRIDTAVVFFGVFDVRTANLTEYSWAIIDRMAHWQAAWEMFVDRPLLGIGPGNYPVAYPAYAISGWPEPYGHAHNIYLNFLAETGVVGTLAYVLFLLWAARDLIRARNTGDWLNRAVVVGCFGVFVAVGGHNFFDNLTVHGMNVQLALTLGLGVGSRSY
ncbi:MAG: O-antigen ligase family protein, partial [Chloroflexi bacterium]|nr:O-antigen ligase family protein [Chloroflexota bacterium]